MTIYLDLSRVSYKGILDIGEQMKVFIGRSPGSSNAFLQNFHADYEKG